MPCYDGLGDIAQKRVWIGKFSPAFGSLRSAAGAREGRLSVREVGADRGAKAPLSLRDLIKILPRSEVLLYSPNDCAWWRGQFIERQFYWRPVGNTASFGQVGDGRPIWIGDFGGTDKDDVLFYFPGDCNWWLGRFENGELSWTLAGNTANFGQVGDGRPIWIGDFVGTGKDDVLFYFPGDCNWWLGRFENGQLSWTLAGNTANFGQVVDGRPIWIGDFAGTGKNDVLFYFPGDCNWWLGRFENGQLSWTLAGNTANFGQVGDGRPIWIGDFEGTGKDNALMYFPGDGNWWLGRFDDNKPAWSLAGNTGRPFGSMIRIHFKTLAEPIVEHEGQKYIGNAALLRMVASIKSLYEANDILVQIGTTQQLDLPDLLDVDVAGCNTGFLFWGGPSDEQEELFSHRESAGDDDFVIYFVRSVLKNGTDTVNGCASHPDGKPGAILAQGITVWTLAHECGHVLGLRHVDDDENLMYEGGTTRVKNFPPDLTADQVEAMQGAAMHCD